MKQTSKHISNGIAFCLFSIGILMLVVSFAELTKHIKTIEIVVK